jgi:hypothetical protein
MPIGLIGQESEELCNMSALNLPVRPNFQLKRSTSGLSSVGASKAESDFAFIGGDETYRCPRFVADFISPKVARLHGLDSSISASSVETRP